MGKSEKKKLKKKKLIFEPLVQKKTKKKKKTLFVTCLYSNLAGTKIGGRVGRSHHYLNSMDTLTNVESDFVIYCGEQDKEEIMKSNFYNRAQDRIRLIVYDLYQHPYHEYFQEKVNGFNDWDRCYEVMHGKILWMNNHLNENYDFMYWIDAGLSHGGLFPLKYREKQDHTFEDYFKCSLFNPTLVENLNKFDDKLVIICGDRSVRSFDAPANHLFYSTIPRTTDYHVVGGLFGGRMDKVSFLCESYKNLLEEMKSYSVLEMEECMISVIYERNKQYFQPLVFTFWHHENSDMASQMNENDIPFYKVFEKLNEI